MSRKFALACAVAFIPLGAAQASAITIESDSSAVPEIATAVATASIAEDESEQAETPDTADGWHFAVTPYLWAPGLSGDVELAPGEQVEVDSKFTDILSDLKFAAMLAFEARNRRFVVIGDILYLSLSTKTDGPRDSPLVEAKVDPAMFIGTLAAGYRVVDKGPLFLDVFAGGRLSALDVGVKLSGPQQTVERSESRSSLAPVVGARFRAPLGDRWGVAIYGDAAGFGATADMSWQLMGTVQYDLSRHWRMAAGYRHVAIRHDKGDFDIDLAISGPIVGFSYRF